MKSPLLDYTMMSAFAIYAAQGLNKGLKNDLNNLSLCPNPRDKSKSKKTKMLHSGYKVQEHKDIGRNDSCPCGSGKKYKKCCLGKVE